MMQHHAILLTVLLILIRLLGMPCCRAELPDRVAYPQQLAQPLPMGTDGSNSITPTNLTYADYTLPSMVLSDWGPSATVGVPGTLQSLETALAASQPRAYIPAVFCRHEVIKW